MKKTPIKDSLEKVLNVLRGGGVVMHPTETCYGLAANIFNEKAVKKVYDIKKMSLGKPVSILVDSLEMAMEYGVFSEKALDLAKEYWPGPLSIVVPRSEVLPEYLNPKEDFVSLRFSDLPFCIEMVSELGKPVTTTSANVTGEYQAYWPKELPGVDLLVDGGEIPENKPSTIVKVVGENLTILRQGGIYLDGFK